MLLVPLSVASIALAIFVATLRLGARASRTDPGSTAPRSLSNGAA